MFTVDRCFVDLEINNITLYLPMGMGIVDCGKEQLEMENHEAHDAKIRNFR